MKERLSKFIIGICLVPLLWVVALLIFVVSFIVPFLALIKPEIINLTNKSKENIDK